NEALHLGDLSLEVGQRAVDTRIDDRDLHRVEQRGRVPGVERGVLAEVPLLRVVRIRRRERRSRGGRHEGSDHRAEQREAQLLHYFTVAACARIRTGAAASFALVSRYLVVTCGLTENWKAPVVEMDRKRVQGVPAVDRWMTTPWTPRTTPLNVTV